MSYFDSLLKKRGYEKCPLPLWKLKITKEEFDELRNLLEKCTHRREEMPFNPNRSLEFLCVVRQREILYFVPNGEERLPCF